MDRIATDILGPFPESVNGNKYILVIMDQFTKFVEAYAIPNQTAEVVAHKIVYEFISRYGVPLEIHSDQGSCYQSNLFHEVCRLLEMHKTRTNPFHPSSNGMVERFNHTLLNMITSYVNDEQDNWDVNLNLVLSAYRSCVHETTGYTPNMLMFGREVSLPIQLTLGIYPETDGKSEVQYVSDLKDKLCSIFGKVRDSVNAKIERQSRNHDSRISQKCFKKGDLVYSLDSTKTKGKSPKLKANVWKGPLVITRKLSDILYEVQYSSKKKPKVIHYDRLKPYACTSVPEWVSNVRQKLLTDPRSFQDTRMQNKNIKTIPRTSQGGSDKSDMSNLRPGRRSRRPPRRYGIDDFK